MAKIATTFFTKQFTTHDTALEEDIAAFLEKVTIKVEAKDREKLNTPILKDEILASAKMLGRNKAPGHNGIPLEFFLEFWEEVGKILLFML